MTFQILNAKVLFSGQMLVDVFLTFQKVMINIGDCLQLDDGPNGHAFIAPIDGIYKLTITAQSAISNEMLSIVRWAKNENGDIEACCGNEKCSIY